MEEAMPKLTTGQICQLIEIDRAGDGIGNLVQELIIRLTSGGVAGKMTDPRGTMAKRLWDRGFGRDSAIKAKNFKAYLAAIPQIPASLIAEDSDLSLLSLADPRPGLLRACQLLGIQYEELGYADGDAEPFDERFMIPAAPFWFRHDDGRANSNRRPDHCRDELATGDIQVGTATEGIFAFAHHPQIVVEGEHIIDLPGTVHHSRRVHCAYLRVWSGRVGLDLSGDSGFADPSYGALRVRRK
ncbi:hypothetical protein HY626_00580 [Candidatus Uhrbacteria bacterium]|nr:hypothetical protein [Candidatus Uhrbacteria bacterium]